MDFHQDLARMNGQYTIIWIQIILVLVFILSRYWFKSIIRSPPPPVWPISFIYFMFYLIDWPISGPPAMGEAK